MNPARSKSGFHILMWFVVLATLLGSAVFLTTARAATLTVLNTNDSGAGSLRDGIAAAAAGDTITFDAALSGGTISVGSTLGILQSVTIDGSSLAMLVTISGAGVRLFYVNSGVTATLDSLIVTQGSATEGGGLLNNGTVIITNSVFSANSANNSGGAIWNGATGTLTITGSTFSNNSAVEGGGITNYNQLTVTNSTFTNNSASFNAGGAIYTTDLSPTPNPTLTQTITNSTFSGNSAAGIGGAIFSSRSQTITNSTFSGNSANGFGSPGANGGAIWQDAERLDYTNTIIANSPLGGDCKSTSPIVININNLVEDGGCATNGVGFQTGDPILGPLASNGGPTKTFALLPNSPAINAGNDTICAATVGSPNYGAGGLDQRGIARPNGDHCDIGAYEHEDTGAPSVTVFTVPSSATSLDVPITTVTASDDGVITGYFITESPAQPSAGAGDWTGPLAPTTYTVGDTGPHNLYPWAKDDAGNVSGPYAPASVDVCLSTVTVTSNADSGAGTLRKAIADACEGGMIDFNASLSGGMIHLASTLTISKNLTINGSLLDEQITISGDTDPLGPALPDGIGDVRVFHTTSPDTFVRTITLDSLIVAKGYDSGEGGGLLADIHTTVNIINSLFSGNSAALNGGAISNFGTVTITDSTFSGNYAANGNGDGGGGAILNSQTLAITGSTFSNNTTGNFGGGGALFNTSTATITNSTFSGNSATGVGGAIITTNNLSITNSTISGNSALATGGLDVEGNVTHLRNTIIANNSSSTIDSTSNNDCVDNSDYPIPPSPDGDGIMTNINNLIEDGSCSAGSTGYQTGDPSLGALADNGGPTETLALLAGSTAIDAGDDATCANSPVSNLDQRGTTRPNGAHCDIGAYEYVDTTAPAVTAFTATSPSSLNVPITAFTASDDAIVAGYLITESSTPPSVGAAGWTASAPTTYIVASDGSYALYPWAKDAVGHVSAVYGSPASVTVETTAPTVVSGARANADPTNAAGVDFIVTFSEAVSGVDTSDFSLVMAAGLTGASVTGVSGGPTVYTVSVNTGSGSGTLRPDLHDDDTIADSAGNRLGGSGLANGNFVTGEFYTIDKTAPTAGSLVAPNVTSGGGTTYSFTLSFSDNLAIDSTSIDGSDIRVTGPGGFDQRATLVSVTPAGNGTPRTATYQITAPGGAWDSLDRGTYTVAVEANQIFDSLGNPVGAASLGSFLVSLNYTAYLPLVLR